MENFMSFLRSQKRILKPVRFAIWFLIGVIIVWNSTARFGEYSLQSLVKMKLEKRESEIQTGPTVSVPNENDSSVQLTTVIQKRELLKYKVKVAFFIASIAILYILVITPILELFFLRSPLAKKDVI